MMLHDFRLEEKNEPHKPLGWIAFLMLIVSVATVIGSVCWATLKLIGGK